MHLVETIITSKDLEHAEVLAKEIGVLDQSITKGKRNIEASLGEIMVSTYLNVNLDRTFDYDMIYNGFLLEVKTKVCVSEPKPNYDVSITAANTYQNCDYYVFTRILKDLSKGWILGFYPKDEYFKSARFCKKGFKDKHSKLGWRFKSDCFNMEIEQLLNIKSLEKL